MHLLHKMYSPLYNLLILKGYMGYLSIETDDQSIFLMDEN